MGANDRTIRLLVKAEVEKALADLNRTEKNIDDLGTSAKSSASSFDGLATGIKAMVSALAVRQVAAFAVETVKLTGQAQDLRRALNRLAAKEGLDTVKLMNDLRKSTQETVSDLQLMQNATQAKFLGLDLKNLPIFFEFATKRARDTGQSVDYLVNSIVTGIGRKSPLILDNLGLQMKDIRAEVEKVAKAQGTWKGVVDESLMSLHLQEAAVNIAKNAIGDSGATSETTATSLQKLNAQWENFKIVIGTLASGPVAQTLGLINDILGAIGINAEKASATGLDKNIITAKENIKEAQQEIEQLDKRIKGISATMAGDYFDPFGSLEKRRNDMLERRAVLAEDIRIYQDYIDRIQKMNQDSVTGATNETPEPKTVSDSDIEKARQSAMKSAIMIARTYDAARQELQDYGDQQVDFWEKVRENAFDKNIEGIKTMAETDLAAAIATTDQLLIVWGDYEEKRTELEQLRAELTAEANARQLEEARQTAYILGGIFEGPMTQLVSNLFFGTKKGANIFKDFIDNLLAEIDRFMSSLLVKGFLNLLANLLWPGVGNVFGAAFNFGAGTATSAASGAIGGGITTPISGGLGIPKMSSITPNSSGLASNRSYSTTSIIDRSVPIMGRVLVETVTPDTAKVSSYFRVVEDNILEPHRNYKNRNLRGNANGVY